MVSNFLFPTEMKKERNTCGREDSSCPSTSPPAKASCMTFLWMPSPSLVLLVPALQTPQSPRQGNLWIPPLSWAPCAGRITLFTPSRRRRAPSCQSSPKQRTLISNSSLWSELSWTATLCSACRASSSLHRRGPAWGISRHKP